MLDEAGGVIYVGKAKNLRRRLGQYKNARRIRAHRKMKTIVADADRIVYETCDTELQAALHEARLIQELRPALNVEGAFAFMYPMVGLLRRDGYSYFCLTTLPQEFAGFRLHGAYRSRGLTREAFYALMRLLAYVGHSAPKKELLPWAAVKYSKVYAFRQLPEAWDALWDRFLSGESLEALEELSLALLENAGARARAREIEEDLLWVKRLWRHEARRLFRVRQILTYEAYPVPQLERDLLLIRYRAYYRERSLARSESAVI